MRQHKFKVGEKVRILPRMFSFSARGDAQAASPEKYEITRLLPPTGFDPQYRLKGSTKGQERIVTESEIAA